MSNCVNWYPEDELGETTPRAGTVKRSLLIVKLMSNKLMTKLSLRILNKSKSAYVPDEYFSPWKNSLAGGRMV